MTLIKMPVNKFGGRGEDEQAETSGLSLSFVNSKFVDTQELKNELNKYMPTSGSIKDLNMNSRRITNVTDPVGPSDVMTKRYFENNGVYIESVNNDVTNTIDTFANMNNNRLIKLGNPSDAML